MNEKHCTVKMMVALLLLSGLVSCTGFLDEKSNFGLQTPNTVESLQGILDNSMDMNMNIPAFSEIHSDDYFFTDKEFHAVDDQSRAFYTWTGTTYNYPDDWAFLYVPVYQANVVLDALPKVDGAKNIKDRIKGAALFYRAYQYLHGIWTYGKALDFQTSASDLGIVLRQTSDQSVPSKRSSVGASYELIISDLSTASDLLPEIAESPMRPSKIACYAALSRTYLSIANYDSAFFYADKVLQVKNDLLDYNDFSPSDLLKPYPLERLNNETIFYAQLTTSYPNLHPNFGLVDTALYWSYSDYDLRKTVLFKSRGEYFTFRGSYTSALNLFGGMAVDEMILIRAETNIRLGRVEKGLDDLNTLLLKRIKKGEYIPYAGLNGQDALNLVKMERRKELLMRGLRWMDIKRYNKYDGDDVRLIRYIDGKKFELEPNSNRYALPLPTDIVLLTGMEQNPL